MSLEPRAVYSDGSYLNLKGASYTDIDRSRLASFCLLAGDRVVFHLVLQEGQRLIWRKRSIMTAGGEEQSWHLVGWQKTLGKENLQCIAYVSERDHSVIMAGEWEGDHILLGKVEPLDFE